MRRTMAALAAVSALGALTLGANPASAHPDDQHGDLDGHLLDTGEWGKIDLLGVVDVTDVVDGEPAVGVQRRTLRSNDSIERALAYRRSVGPLGSIDPPHNAVV